MNVFFIPSWYPSATDPLPGIFFREQAMALTRNFQDMNIGVSTWGQNDERLLLWAGEPIKTFSKRWIKSMPPSGINELVPNRLAEYFTPAYSWTSKVFGGNMRGIVGANMKNLSAFQHKFGSVDIIHAHVGYPAGHIARRIAAENAIPYIITEHMGPFPHKYFRNRSGGLIANLSKAYQASKCNVAVSDSLAEDMKRQGIENLTIIPNLVDGTHFRALEKSANKDKFIFFTLARMIHLKGFDILLKAFSKLHTDAELRIGGEGPSKEKYEKLSRDLHIDHKVTWLGALDKNQALKEYQNCDAFALASRHESMGVVFAEAMACGKPVIATICGGPEEFIDESVGYLVPNENVEVLADTLDKMVKNGDQFHAGIIREKFEKRFSSEVITRQIREVYEGVIKNHIIKKE